MKKQLFLLVICFSLFFSGTGGLLPAESPKAPASSPSGVPLHIALIDVTKLFKEDTGFKEQTEELKKEMSEAETKVKDQNNLIMASQEQLKNMEAGSNAYTDLEEKITRNRAELTMEVQKQRKDFLKKETNLYASHIQEIEREIQVCAQEKQLDLVLRFNGEEMKPDDSNSVMGYLHRPVIWHNKKLDITPEIKKRLEKKAKRPEPAKKTGPTGK